MPSQDLPQLQWTIRNSSETYSISGVDRTVRSYDPQAALRDVSLFPVYRAQITNELFTQIVQDHYIVTNYGPPQDHYNEETRSRVLAPLFTHTVALFKLLVRNTPESIIEGRLPTKVRIEHLHAFGVVAILFIQVKFMLKTGKEYLDTVAQVIAEATACDYINSNRDLRTPIYAVLCDGTAFEFFMYTHHSNPRLSMGCFLFLASPTQFGQQLKLADLRTESVAAFLLSARQICEALFHISILGYRNALQAYYDRFMKRAQESSETPDSTPQWSCSLGHVYVALDQTRRAAHWHADGQIDAAEAHAVLAAATLEMSVQSAPEAYRRADAQALDSHGWDSETIRNC
ncbi:hypothetical protein Q9L58_005895 [Maublancomyces gigas]|uniref:Uncharacterized protein n=1 Tax=Discina gigas TaxID=1032678 RepID=A0ABR3GHA3_9PEZI